MYKIRTNFCSHMLAVATVFLMALVPGQASAYTTQDLLDADKAVMDAQNEIAAVQTDGATFGPWRMRIDNETRDAERGCEIGGATGNAKLECYEGVAADFQRALDEYDSAWNDYWIRLSNAEAAYTSAVFAYNEIYDALNPR